MVNRFPTIAVVTLAATFATAGLAQAQPTRKAHVAHIAKVAHPSVMAELSAPPLTVRKRSFLDPGNVVAAGSETPEYYAANTTDHVPVYASYAPAFFGESELPRRFDLPDNDRFYPRHDLDFSPF